MTNDENTTYTASEEEAMKMKSVSSFKRVVISVTM